MRVLGLITLAVTCSRLAVVPIQAQTLPEFRISRALVPPTIDGDLSDAVWDTPPLALTEWVSYNPFRGEKGAPTTEVRIAYDDRNLYIAFRCVDSAPDKIRTTLAKRDTVFNDDWIGLSLDSTASGQTAYHLFVN